jgi:hypothetical protein
MLLKAKRREELLRRKLELEEEKERLTRALAADLKNKGKAVAAAAAAKRAPLTNSAPATAPPSAPLPAPPLPLPPTLGDLPSPPPLNGKPPPKKGKKKRSAYANANNVHHRQNYIPSRLPASSGGKKDAPEGGTTATGGSLDLALPHDNDSEVFNFAPDDWMCTFCEYELWYGTKPQLAKCVKKRKKLLKVRQKALERAKGTVEGTNKPKNSTAATVPPATTAPTPTSAQKPSDAQPTTPKSAATLPGTAEQQAKAENAKPTRAPPPSPASKNAALKAATLPAPTLASPKVGKEMAKQRHQLGISQEKLLSCRFRGATGYLESKLRHLTDHCAANNLPAPVYYFTDMRIPPSPRTGNKEYPYQACSIRIGKEIYKLGILSNEVLSLGKMIAKIPAMSGDAKEDVAKRVLQHLVSGEKLQWNMSHAVSKEGLVVYRPGEKDFICSLKEASQLYMNASALLEGKATCTYFWPYTDIQLQNTAD